ASVGGDFFLIHVGQSVMIVGSGSIGFMGTRRVCRFGSTGRGSLLRQGDGCEYEGKKRQTDTFHSRPSIPRHIAIWMLYRRAQVLKYCKPWRHEDAKKGRCEFDSKTTGGTGTSGAWRE